MIYLIDLKKYAEAVKYAESLVQKVSFQNRRTLDMLAAKCYFYYSKACELTQQLDKIRTFLHARLSTSTLRSDFENQAMLLNLLLRNYLNLFGQADKLVSKSTFPESASIMSGHVSYTTWVKSTQHSLSTQRHKIICNRHSEKPHSTVL